MAFAMTTQGLGSVTARGPVEIVFPQSGTQPAIQLADQTATTAVQTLLTACTRFRAVIYLKTYTIGTGTIGPQFTLEAASVVGFGTTRTVVDAKYAAAVGSATEVQCLVLEGIVPVSALGFCRVGVVFSGTDSGTFDVLIEATP